MRWYNSLTNKGSLNWDLNTDFCNQVEIGCDSSNPKRIRTL